MRKSLLLFLFLSLTANISSQEKELSAGPASHNNSILFHYTILKSKPKPTDFTIIGDTVNFEIYYVDYDCDSYKYVFEKKGKKVFIVRRIPSESGTCDKDYDVLYAFEGQFTGVPVGTYQFQLESSFEGSKSVIFREVFTVK